MRGENMANETGSLLAPVPQGDRIIELDVLRGVALFGVLLMNFVGFTGPDVLATEAQLSALPTAAVDKGSYFAAQWLVGDKANTMFATLFGLGFYLQLKRGEGRPGFMPRYVRRLSWLLVFGCLNLLFLWVWDILHLYALAGFALLAMRRWRTRTLMVFGALAALYSDKLQDWWTEAIGLQLKPEGLWSDNTVLERQAAVLSGEYPRIVQVFWNLTWGEWLAGGMIIAWVVYALGRFALGAAIGRSGILENVRAHLPLLRRIALVAIPLGLIAALLVRLLGEEVWTPFEGAESLGQVLRSPAALLLAAGYAAGIVVALHTRPGARLFGVFAPVGQMALTNYLVQGFLYAFVLTGAGPSLGLAGQVGTSTVILICAGFFALQILFSRWWLRRFRFGPMEWLWRALTYGERPTFRRPHALAGAALQS
ncbi:DUF418 domain-containing protein [soil metagenome]